MPELAGKLHGFAIRVPTCVSPKWSIFEFKSNSVYVTSVAVRVGSRRVREANGGDGGFVDVSDRSGPDAVRPVVGRGTAFGDLDNDGDQDVVIANGHIYPEVDGATRDIMNIEPVAERHEQSVRTTKAR